MIGRVVRDRWRILELLLMLVEWWWSRLELMLLLTVVEAWISIFKVVDVVVEESLICLRQWLEKKIKSSAGFSANSI